MKEELRFSEQELQTKETVRWLASTATIGSAEIDAPAERPEGESFSGNALQRPIVLIDSCIVHSSYSDIMVNVLYKHAQDFMTYVREVVQTSPHVVETQTLIRRSV